MVKHQDCLKVISEKESDLLDPRQLCEAGQLLLSHSGRLDIYSANRVKLRVSLLEGFQAELQAEVS